MPPKIEKKSLLLARAAVGVAAIGLVSKLLGFLREVVLAKYFGATAATDAYLVAMVIPAILVGALIGAISITFIPILAEYEARRGKAAAFRLVNNTLNLLLLLSVVLGIVGYLLAPQVVSILAPGFHRGQAALAIQLTRIMLPAVLATALTGLATAVLQSRQRFWIPAAVGLPYNFVLITAIVLSDKSSGIAGVAVGTALAIFSQALIQFPSLYRLGFRYQPVLDLGEDGLRKMGILIWPVLIGIAAAQLNTVIDRWLASTLAEGSISALNYAFRLVMLPQGLIVGAITSVTYPLFSQMAATNRGADLQEAYLKTAKVLVLFFVPLTAGMVVLREPFVRAAFQRGAFNASDTISTAVALLFYSLGLLSYALNDLSAKVFLAVQDTRTPVMITVLMVGCNVVLNLILVKPMAHGGLALATSMASTLGAGSYFGIFRRRYGIKGGRGLLVVAGVAVAASVLMGAGVSWLYNVIPAAWKVGGFLRQVTVLLSLAGIGAVFYLVLIKATRLPEGDALFEMISKIMHRNKPATRLPQEADTF